MAKKTIEEAVAPEPVATIPTVSHDFSREDLNELRDRVNDLVAVVNNSLTK